MKRYYVLMLFVLNTGLSFGQDVVHTPLNEQLSSNESVRNDIIKGLLYFNKVVLESAQITYHGIITACYSFIPTYVLIHLLRSGVPSVSDLIKALNKDERLRYASLAGALGFLMHYSDVFKINGKYLNLTEAEFDAAIEKCAEKFAADHADMPPEEIRQKALAYVTQKVNSAPVRLLGACCSLAACGGVAYSYCKNA